MSRTSNLRRQHEAALDIVRSIVAMTGSLGEAPSKDHACEITLALAKLAGLLRIHFAQEDMLLYPSLIGSDRSDAASTAKRFANEMSRIGPALDRFMETWRQPGAIQSNVSGFRAESEAMWAALGERVKRENEELYPLADAIALKRTERSAA